MYLFIHAMHELECCLCFSFLSERAGCPFYISIESHTYTGENSEYYTYAIQAEKVTGLEISNFDGEAAHPERYDPVALN